MEVAMLESTLAHCVVFHDHFPQPGQHPVLILACYHVHPDLYEGAGVAASFLVANLLKPRPNVATSTLPPTLHPPATKQASKLQPSDLPAACLVPIGHHHQHVPSLLHGIGRVFI